MNVRLPLPVEETGPNATVIYTDDVKAKLAAFFKDKFFNEWNTFPGTYYHGGAIWCRISVQVWTEVSHAWYLSHTNVTLNVL